MGVWIVIDGRTASRGAADGVEEIGHDELLAALQAEGATDPCYRFLCARAAGEVALWLDLLDGKEERHAEPLGICTDSADAMLKDLVPLVQAAGPRTIALFRGRTRPVSHQECCAMTAGPSVVRRLGLVGEAPLQNFREKADLLGTLVSFDC